MSPDTHQSVKFKGDTQQSLYVPGHAPEAKFFGDTHQRLSFLGDTHQSVHVPVNGEWDYGQDNCKRSQGT